MKSLARAHENGVGVERDLARAFGYLLLLKASSPSDVGPDLARISKQLSAAELDRAKAFRLSDDPATPEFVKEYEVREPPKGWFKRVNSL